MTEALVGAAVLLAYYALTLGALPIALRAFTATPREVVRKLQHLAYALSVFLLLGLFRQWYMAVGAAFGLVVVAFPVLTWWSRRPSYGRLLTPRGPRGGDLLRQMLYVQFTFAVLLAVFWGALGPTWRPVIVAAVLVWGFGDAAAALVGRFLGRHVIERAGIDGAKTVEGALAMAIAAAVVVFATLFVAAGRPWWVSLAAALVVAPIASTVEVFSRRGIDTLTVPLITAGALLPLLHLSASFGW
jgi:phytol kinase